MPLARHQHAADFLQSARAELLQSETANSLMLGLALRLEASPGQTKGQPYLATVTADDGAMAAAAVMTPPHNLVIYGKGAAANDALQHIAQDLHTRDWPVPGVLGQVQTAKSFAQIWEALTGNVCRLGMNMRIYELRKVNHPAYYTGRLRTATPADLDTLIRWVLGFNEETFGSSSITLTQAQEIAAHRVEKQSLHIWDIGNIPVSMAATSRPTPNGISISMVYTPPARRGQGYASACVAQLSQKMLDAGCHFCCLFTDLANPTSNSIYQRIGYTPVSNANEYIFETAPA